MLNKSLNKFKFNSTRFQQTFNFFVLSTMFKFDSTSFQHFYTLNNVNDLFKRPRHLVQQSIERMLQQKLNSLNRRL